MNFLDSSRWHAKAHLPFWILFTVHGNFKAVAYGNKDEIKLKVSCLYDQIVDTTNERRNLPKSMCRTRPLSLSIIRFEGCRSPRPMHEWKVRKGDFAYQLKLGYLPRMYPTMLITAKLLVYVVRCSSHSSLLVLLSHNIS